jgi:hypothetical protein
VENRRVHTCTSERPHTRLFRRLPHGQAEAERRRPGRQAVAALVSGDDDDLREQGVPLEDVQRLAGQPDPRTTRHYDRRDNKIAQNIFERISI